VRPGGHVANIGVHGKPATLHLESLPIDGRMSACGADRDDGEPFDLGDLTAGGDDDREHSARRPGVANRERPTSAVSQDFRLCQWIRRLPTVDA